MAKREGTEAMDSLTSELCLNTLLAGLPQAAWDRLRRYLIPVYLPLGQVLYEPGVKPDSVYFPTTAIVSLQYESANGTRAEMAVVGNEGMVGIALFLGGDTSSTRAVVDSPGEAYRLKALLLKQEISQWGVFQDRILLYTQALITQMAQTAVCNRHHSVEQQLCRWLAGRLDRQHSSELIATHERIAAGLGVRRESVTSAAANLQHAGVIRYQRGHILVLDRAGLEEHCCECYAVLKQEAERLSHIPTRFTATPALIRAGRPMVRPRGALHEHASTA
jgi:CRP-like cAMP-binding protein